MTTPTEPAPPFTPLTGTSVLENDQVTREDLLRLTSGDAIAIVIRGFAGADECARAVERLFADEQYKEYADLPGVHMWGFNSSESLSRPDQREVYLERAMATVRSLRAIWAPFLSPVDRLRLELQESWPAGANLEYVDDRALFVGQARVFGERGALPHQDFMPWELARLDGAESRGSVVRSQLTANIYLQTSDRGGELQLWSTGFDHDEYVSLREQPGVPGLDRERIPVPTVEIAPEPGMLVLSHTTRLHAVLPSSGRPRMALSFFVGVRGATDPLTYWS